MAEEMGRVCGMHVRDAYKVLMGTLKELDCLEDLCIDGRIILKSILIK
jgi:hypothetical protein